MLEILDNGAGEADLQAIDTQMLLFFNPKLEGLPNQNESDDSKSQDSE
jgi:hypothetical protein